MASKTEFNMPAESIAQLVAVAAAKSAVTQAAKQIPLNGNGATMHYIGEVEAKWQSAEGAVKSVTPTSGGSIEVTPYDVYALFPVSNQLIADGGNIFEGLLASGAPALAKALDNAVFFGPTPGANFDTLVGVPTVEVSDYATLIAAIGASAAASGSEPTHVVADARLIWGLRAIVDGMGRPLFDDAAKTLAGLPVVTFKGKTGTVPAAYVGDFAERAVWGQVGDVKVQTSEDATIGGVSMFETNQTAVRIETRYGFRTVTPTDYVKIVIAPAV